MLELYEKDKDKKHYSAFDDNLLWRYELKYLMAMCAIERLGKEQFIRTDNKLIYERNRWSVDERMELVSIIDKYHGKNSALIARCLFNESEYFCSY